MYNLKIGCNWSNSLAELVEDEIINIDFIKAGEQKDFQTILPQMLKLKKVLLHGGVDKSLRIGNIVEFSDYKLLNTLIERCGTPQYGIHIAFTNDEYKKYEDEIILYKNISKNLKIFKQKLRVPILLENTPDCKIDRKIYGFHPFVYPEQISKVIYENDLGFLLDITHAKITCKYNEWDVKNYLSCLPLEKVKEIHVNGWGIKNGIVMDGHKSMEKEDYNLLEWVLERTNPNIVSLEYSGNVFETNENIKNNIRQFLTFMGR